MKRIFSLIICLALGAALAGCSKSDAASLDINPADAASTLVSDGGFADTQSLITLPENLLGSYYSMDDAVSEYAIYVDGSGGTTREVAVLKTADAKDLSKARAVLDARLAKLRSEFENYRPDEIKKIDSAVIVEKGNMVFMVLSDNPQKAQQAIDSLIK